MTKREMSETQDTNETLMCEWLAAQLAAGLRKDDPIEETEILDFEE